MGNTIGERIAELRKKNNFTQIELAEKLNISDKAVSKWEVNKCDPSLDLIVSMADLFNCSIDYIVRGKEIKNEKIGNVAHSNFVELDNLFKKACDIIKTQVAQVEYDLYINSIHPIELKDNILILGVESFAIRNIIMERFFGTIHNAFKYINDEIAYIKIVVEDISKNLIKNALKIIITSQRASISHLVRMFDITYLKAGRLMSRLEELGFVSVADFGKKTKILITKEQYEELYNEKL